MAVDSRAAEHAASSACVSTFPAVPMNKPSIRFTVSRHNSFADVRAMVEALVEVSTSLSPSSFSQDRRLRQRSTSWKIV